MFLTGFDVIKSNILSIKITHYYNTHHFFNWFFFHQTEKQLNLIARKRFGKRANGRLGRSVGL